MKPQISEDAPTVWDLGFDRTYEELKLFWAGERAEDRLHVLIVPMRN